MEKEKEDDLENKEKSTKERAISYSEGGDKNPFLNSLSMNINDEREKFSFVSKRKNSMTSNLNILFRESILFAEKKKSLRNSIFKQSYNLERKIILENNKENEIKFGNFINEKLNNLKNKFNSYLNEIQNKIEEKYINYINFIDNYINNNEEKISKISRGKSTEIAFINYADRNIFKQIDLILEILENLFNSIKDNISLLSNFLDETSLVFEKNPLETYINNNSKLILDSFILSKIDFQKLNLTNLIDNSTLSEIFKNYFSKKQNNTCSSLEIEKKNDEIFRIESNFLKENFKNLQKLKLKKIELNHNSIYSYLQQNIKNNIESLYINKCGECCLNQFPICPNMIKFIIKNTKIKKMFIGDKLIFYNLQQIKFRNCNLNDDLLKDFFKLIIKNPQIKENLEVLDFSENLFTLIDLREYIDENGNLNELKYFDLSGNNIYNFVLDNFTILQNLQVLDLTDNNITSSNLFEGILETIKIQKFLALLGKNLFVSNNNKNRENYKQYLFENLQQCEYQLSNLVFSLLFNQNNCHSLQNLILSPSIKLSLKKLNLSYCGLNSNVLINFLQGNYGLLSLKKINLSYNFLTNEIFNLYKPKKKEENELKEEKIIFEKLLKIDLSFNKEIKCENINELEQFYSFISETPFLRKVKLQGTKFEYNYFERILKDEEKLNEIESNIPNKNLIIYFQKKFQNQNVFKILNIIAFKDKKL
jgi:hypothetical protein